MGSLFHTWEVIKDTRFFVIDCSICYPHVIVAKYPWTLITSYFYFLFSLSFLLSTVLSVIPVLLQLNSLDCILTLLSHLSHHCKALSNIISADVPLRNYSLIPHSLMLWHIKNCRQSKKIINKLQVMHAPRGTLIFSSISCLKQPPCQRMMPVGHR